MAERTTSVLFVCTGNICRSPTAEGVLRHMARARGVAGRIRIDSAGIIDYHVGSPPDPRAVEHAARRGYDISDLRARQLTFADYHQFERILAMDRTHLREWRNRMTPRKYWQPEQIEFDKQWTDFKKETETVDFTDLIELALQKLVHAPGNPNAIFVDEAQDFTNLQLAVIRSWGVLADYIILVGADDQALYT